MHVSTPRVPLHVKPGDDVDVILANVEIGSTSHLLALCCIASRACPHFRSHRRRCRPYPRAARAQDIARVGGVCSCDYTFRR
jgi:hypothetical protein